MAVNNNILQLRRSGNIYATRDEALADYKFMLSRGLETIAEASPTLLFYQGENEGDTDILIVVGLPEGKTYNGNNFFVVDTAKLQELISNIDTKYDEAITSLSDALATETEAREEGDKALDEKINNNTTTIMELVQKEQMNENDILGIVEACGLSINKYAEENRISYSPNTKVDLIDDARDIINAIVNVAKFAQMVEEESQLEAVDSDTVDFTLSEATKGKTIKADVRVAGADGLSKRVFDNNIIGITKEGLYAAVSLIYDKDTDELTLQTSGYDSNGNFKVDTFGEPIKLQNHTKYTGDNGKSTGVNVNVDAEKLEISAELNLSDHSNNILVKENGSYLVEGTAANIKYGQGTVAQALNTQSSKIASLLDENLLGGTTDTTDVLVSKVGTNTSITSNVKLSSDNSITVKEGGLSANVTASFVKASNSLVFTVGNHDYTIDLSSMGVSFLKKTPEYDSATESLILTFDVNGREQIVTIPMGTLIHDLDSEDTNSIALKIRSVLGGPNVISANLKVDQTRTDNILTVNPNGAYVSKAHITEAVSIEKSERVTAIQNLSNALDNKADTDSVYSKLEANNKFASKSDVYLKSEADNKFTSNDTFVNAINSINATMLPKSEADIKFASKTSLDNITLKKVSDLEYELVVDGVNKGTLSIPKDKFLKSVSYNPTTKSLDFLFTTSDSETPTLVSVSLTDLSQVYTAGFGLKLQDNQFSIDSDAIMSKEGVQSELNKKANASDTYTKDEVDNTFITSMQASIDYLSKNDANSTYLSKLDAQTTLASYAKTAEVENALTQKANADNVYSKAESQDIFLTKDDASQTYLTQLQAAQQYALKESVDTKANAADVYTKLEVKEELEKYALENDVDSKLETKANSADVANVYATKEALNSLTQESATKNEVNEKTDAIQALVDANETAIANINLSYNPATSTLSFTNKNGVEKEYQLYSGSLIKGGHFDEATNSIVLEISTSGVDSEITIPVSDLLSDISKDIEKNTKDIADLETAIDKLAKSWDTTDSKTVSLTKTINGDKENLTANVRVASSNKQAIQTAGDGLYVSNDLEDYTVVFGGEGTISGQQAISKLLDSSNAMKNEISSFDKRITQNESNITTLRTQVENNTQSLANLNTRVTSIETKIASVETKLNNLSELVETIIGGGGEGASLPELLAEIIKIKNATGYDTYTKPQTMSARIDALEAIDADTEIANIKDNLIGDKENPNSGSVWYELNNNIVDAGTY